MNEPCEFCNNGHGKYKLDYYVPDAEKGIYNIDGVFILLTYTESQPETLTEVTHCPICERNLTKEEL